MRFMNESEIDDARERWSVLLGHPILGPATCTLANLRDVVNAHGDGWAYWRKPLQAASKLMELIEGDGTWDARFGERHEVTDAQLRAAYRPIKSFLTRNGLKCEIVEPQ